MGASLLLPRLISQQTAAEYLLTGKTVKGSVAVKDGLVLEAVDKVTVTTVTLRIFQGVVMREVPIAYLILSSAAAAACV